MAEWASIGSGGLYTIPAAARILGAEPSKVRSWVEGYPHSSAKPILARQVERVGGRTVLVFLDLVESAFIRHFRVLGFSAQTLRKLAVKLRERHKVDHPFAMNKRFRDDGKMIFEEIVEDSGEKKLLNLMSDNFEFEGVVARSLFDRILYVADLASTWRPLEGHNAIIIDPRRSFGAPILDEWGVPTETLMRAFKAEGSIEAVAEEFEIPPESIADAIRFERELDERTIH